MPRQKNTPSRQRASSGWAQGVTPRKPSARRVSVVHVPRVDNGRRRTHAPHPGAASSESARPALHARRARPSPRPATPRPEVHSPGRPAKCVACHDASYVAATDEAILRRWRISRQAGRGRRRDVGIFIGKSRRKWGGGAATPSASRPSLGRDRRWVRGSARSASGSASDGWRSGRVGWVGEGWILLPRATWRRARRARATWRRARRGRGWGSVRQGGGSG